MGLLGLLRKPYESVTHALGRLTGRYFFEDYVRVYPDDIAFHAFGLPIRRKADKNDKNNFLNHSKFYRFAAQFAKGKVVADIGCGSGYGCAMLQEAGASKVHGCDVSGPAVKFADERYGKKVKFDVQGITDLKAYPDDMVDLAISSEVLEHIKEYGQEERAIAELKRITRPGGLLIIATPNSELLGDHGFHFEEFDALFRRFFGKFLIFENALLPWDAEGRALWERRSADKKVGTIVSEGINLDETVLPPGVRGELKSGEAPGRRRFEGLEIDTTLLHNTHSWIALAINSK